MVSIKPGEAKTNSCIGRRLGLKVNIIRAIAVRIIAISIEDGVENYLWGATSKDVKITEYYEPVGVGGKASKSLRMMSL
ncbi:hypothetical protein BKA67DRAFT_71395 [Truncatella angustata]|uniref:Uncharacterized protein n=1 Tax=Truncatella angustata TaxID=152316 RepID=A0A9P9A3Y1_9PEZI|nr:uncharacterized protein BKA67DRAFT_71395 [Truncatella angustata]KAH6660962.1 hypothetical protein BKA67DRAFT_71395 [Truncatella angustata]